MTTDRGIFVEFHDIYLPFEYPQEWGTWYYNEQYLLVSSILTEGNKYEIVFPGMFITQDSELSKILNPLWETPEMQGVKSMVGHFGLKENKKVRKPFNTDRLFDVI